MADDIADTELSKWVTLGIGVVLSYETYHCPTYAEITTSEQKRLDKAFAEFPKLLFRTTWSIKKYLSIIFFLLAKINCAKRNKKYSFANDFAPIRKWSRLLFRHEPSCKSQQFSFISGLAMACSMNYLVRGNVGICVKCYLEKILIIWDFFIYRKLSEIYFTSFSCLTSLYCFDVIVTVLTSLFFVSWKISFC